MKKLKVAVIGMGYIGESHIEALRRIELCEIAAVADVNVTLAKQKAALYGIDKVYGDIDGLLQDKDIDAIHNCTPNNLHKDINIKVLQAGKHLFTEKPLCRDYAEALEILAAAKSNQSSVAGVNFNYRLNPMVQEMRGRIARGELGTVRVISGGYQQDWLLYDTDYSWRLEREAAGISCAVADIGSHFMDAVQHVTGDRITEVMADLVTVIPVRKKPVKQAETFTSTAPAAFERKEVENEDYAAVIFKTDSGATGVFHVSEVAAGHGCYFNMELNGSKCSMRWNQEENDRLWIGRRGGDNSLIIRDPGLVGPEARPYTKLAMGHPEGWNDAFKGSIYSFYRYVLGDKKDKPPFATLEDAAYLVKLTECIVQSSETKAWVKVNQRLL